MKKLSTKGYKKDSPDKNNSYNIIGSNSITMKGVPHRVYGEDQFGNGQMMYPGVENYQFPGNRVTEIPLKGQVDDYPIFMQQGGQSNYTPAQWNKLNSDKGLLASPGASINLSGNQNSKYLDFYDPHTFLPSNPDPNNNSQINWSKINDPGWKYTDNNDSPFISYKPSQPMNASKKKFVQPSDERTAVGFQPNYTTYKYKDGSVKYQDTKGNLYNSSDELQAYLESLSKMQMGGPMDKFISRYATKQLNTQAPQGESMDDFLTNKNNNFLNYVSSNVKRSMVQDELDNYKQGYAQMGAEINPVNQSNFYSGPFGLYANQPVPDYVNSYKQSHPYNPSIAPPAQGNQNQQTDNFRHNNNIADIGMAAAQTTNNLFNIYHNRQQDLYNQNQMTIDKTSQLQYGNRGDYDINTGKLRPNQYGTPSYQMGGGIPNPPLNYDDNIIFNSQGDKLLNLSISESKNNKIKKDNQEYYNIIRDSGMTEDEYYKKFPNKYEHDKNIQDTKIKNRFNPDMNGMKQFKKGGSVKKYKRGGEYTIGDDKEISDLLSQGYQFEILE